MPLEPENDSQPGCYGGPTHGRPENKCYEKGHRAVTELLLEPSWELQNDGTSTIQRGTEILETVGEDDSWLVPISILATGTQNLTKAECICKCLVKNKSKLWVSLVSNQQGVKIKWFAMLFCCVLSFLWRIESLYSKSEFPVREGSCLSCSDKERGRNGACPKL